MISTPAVFVYLGPCARNNLGTHEEEVVLSFVFSSFGGPCDSGDDHATHEDKAEPSAGCVLLINNIK